MPLQDIRGSRVEWRVEVTELERRRVRSHTQHQARQGVADCLCVSTKCFRVRRPFSAEQDEVYILGRAEPSLVGVVGTW
jgi:hypothetical protein